MANQVVLISEDLHAFEYEQSYNAFLGAVIRGFVKDDDLIGDIRRHRTKHGGPTRNVAGDDPLDHDQVEVAFQAPIEHGALKRLDIEAHTTFFAQLARSNVEEMRAMMLKHVGEVCTAVGNSRDMQGAPISRDVVLDMIEMVDIQFDDQENPVMPSIVIQPEMMRRLLAEPETAEHRARHQSIMKAKKEAWLKNLRTRRLALM